MSVKNVFGPYICNTECPLAPLSETLASKVPPTTGLLPVGFARLETATAISVLYEPLRPWQTRIIELLPGHTDMQLNCKLLTVEFVDMDGVGLPGTEEIISYEALSYSWGNQELTVSIWCNEIPCNINLNLAGALMYLRHPTSSRYLWADAICINQQDVKEKGHQVRNILRIFEKARQVIAWIGRPHQPSTPVLFRALKDDQIVNCIVNDDFGPKGPHVNQCREVARRLYSHLLEHLSRSWFFRTWVRQEVFAAQKITVQCGSETIQFSDLLRQTSRLMHCWREGELAVDNRGSDKMRASFPTKSYFILARDFQHGGTDHHDYEPPRERLRHTAHWFRTLSNGTFFEVTDPRDRIYGVLGMIQSQTCRRYVEDRPEIRQGKFPIDYSKSISEVFQDVVKFLINIDRNIDILTLFEDKRSRPTDLPSWAPDWRQNISRAFLVTRPDRANENKHFGIAQHQDIEDKGKLNLVGRSIGALEYLDSSEMSPQTLDVPGEEKMSEDFIQVAYKSGSYISAAFSDSQTGFLSKISAPQEAKAPRSTQCYDRRFGGFVEQWTVSFLIARDSKEGRIHIGWTYMCGRLHNISSKFEAFRVSFTRVCYCVKKI